MKTITSLEEKLFRQLFYNKPKIRDSTWCMKLFFYLYRHGKTRRMDLLESLDISHDKILTIALRGMWNEKIIEKVPTEGNAVYYKLSSKYNSAKIDHLFYLEKVKNKEKSIFLEMDWNDEQKAGFILCQKVLSKLNLTNQQVADMFSTFEDKEDAFTLFQFSTGRWLNDKEVNKIVETISIKRRE